MTVNALHLRRGGLERQLLPLPPERQRGDARVDEVLPEVDARSAEEVRELLLGLGELVARGAEDAVEEVAVTRERGRFYRPFLSCRRHLANCQCKKFDQVTGAGKPLLRTAVRG